MLIWEKDVIREFPVKLRTNRDCENVLVKEFIEAHPDINSLLDVGAHHSHANYAHDIRKLVKDYEVIDIIPDPPTEVIVDKYHIGNFNDKKIQRGFDCVISISVFEHAGISTYTADHDKEVMSLFKNCLLYAKKYVFLTFDVGQPHVTDGQHSPITKHLWDEMLQLAGKYKVKKSFAYTQGSQAGHPWILHNKEDVAFKIPYIFFVGNQSIGILEIDKT